MACARLGQYCEAGLAATDGKGRRLFTLSDLLADQETPGQPSARRYRNDFDRFPVEAA